MKKENELKKEKMNNQVQIRLRSSSCTTHRVLINPREKNRLGESFQNEDVERKCGTNEESENGDSSEKLSDQIVDIISEVENITNQMTKNMTKRQQIQKRIEGKKQPDPKEREELLQNQETISQLREAIKIKKNLIELMQYQQKRIRRNTLMNVQQLQNIQTNLSKRHFFQRKIVSQGLKREQARDRLQFVMENKEIDGKMKEKMKYIQYKLHNKNFDDLNLSLYEKYQKRLIQFKLQNENKLKQLMDKEIQSLIGQNLDIESELYQLDLKYKKQFQQCEQQKEDKLISIKYKYNKSMKNIQEDYIREMDQLNQKRQNFIHNIGKQQAMVKENFEKKKKKDQIYITDRFKQEQQKRILQLEKLQKFYQLFNKQKRPQMDELNLKIVQISNSIKQLNKRLTELQNDNIRRQLEGEMQKMIILKNDLDQRLKQRKQEQKYIQSNKNSNKDYQYGCLLITKQIQKRKKEAYEEAQKRYQQKYRNQNTYFEDRKERCKKKYLGLQTQYKTKYQNGKNDCQKNFQKEQSFCVSKYKLKSNTIRQKMSKYLQPSLTSYPFQKTISEILHITKNQIKIKQDIKLKIKLQQINNRQRQTFQHIEKVYKRNLDHLLQCFKSTQPQKSRFYSEKKLEDQITQQQYLKQSLKKQLQNQQEYEKHFIKEEQFKCLKDLQHQYNEFKLQKEMLEKNRRKLRSKQYKEFILGKDKQNQIQINKCYSKDRNYA